MKELSKQDVEMVLAGKGLPGELLFGESLAKYFARLYLATKESRDSQIARMEVELSGADERSKMIFEAKNHWADRARKAEAQIAALDDALSRLAGTMLNRTLDSGSKQAVAYAECADMVAKFAKQLREGQA